jgi:rod shape determining protein RodA
LREEKNIFSNIDWVMILLYLSLVFIGWINIYASAYNEEHKSILDFSQNYGKQLIWIATSIVLGLIINSLSVAMTYFPILILTGVITGIIVGMTSLLVIKYMRHFKLFT